eukprot:CAMPEP_0194140326 /NCGR_PEP_ID=MMETSP0152-20130528/9876_1 /TAXON_ID=1049557 /ORGANISM="Thalassiothrix antarctica, Strain L6-D1" /LENGTH=186 /DNA_ID=CAMNT_0038838527 /DNA_START=93 /DNA_END=655 /DNA_ORIENTATION=-
MKAFFSTIAIAALLAPSAAFSPLPGAGRPSTSIAAASDDRRAALTNIAKFVGGAIATTAAPAFAAGNPALGPFHELIAGGNPALGGWRSKKKGGGDGSYKPGKGMLPPVSPLMNLHESFDKLVAASNPALSGWRSKKKGSGDVSYKPGKGMLRANQSFDELLTASNPVLADGGGRKTVEEMEEVAK